MNQLIPLASVSLAVQSDRIFRDDKQSAPNFAADISLSWLRQQSQLCFIHIEVKVIIFQMKSCQQIIACEFSKQVSPRYLKKKVEVVTSNCKLVLQVRPPLPLALKKLKSQDPACILNMQDWPVAILFSQRHSMKKGFNSLKVVGIYVQIN
ncbi:UNKNOWN [Stylonychia lemnae]|uniref:Uncharacterized protein n=1 Tax=Stylonychia lemnae TaxID=5949 RepID=A0A078A1P6_STYLE|nr:UNKNOWN [Stylonychia lemnae]|eukprot:CDW74704.1 UNKNOWN [Stylonychia lemnae]